MKRRLPGKTANRWVCIAFVLMFALLALTPLVPEAEIASCLMVNALGIDVNGGTVALTAETSGGSSTESVHGEGGCVTDALHDMSERYGRNIELGHCGVIVMGGEMSAADVCLALMSLLSEAEVNAGCAVISASGGAGEFIDKAVTLTTAAGSGVTSYIGFADTSASVAIPTALSVLGGLKSKSAAAALPVFAAEESDAETGTRDSQNSGSDGGGAPSGASEKQSELVPSRLMRAVGTNVSEELSESASLGLTLLSPRSDGGTYAAEWTYDGETTTILGEIRSKKASVSARFEGGKVIAEAELSVVVRFKDRFKVIERGDSVKALASSLERAFAAAFSSHVSAAAEVCRRCDILGVLTELYRAYPREYAALVPDLSDMTFSPSVSVKVS